MFFGVVCMVGPGETPITRILCLAYFKLCVVEGQQESHLFGLGK